MRTRIYNPVEKIEDTRFHVVLSEHYDDNVGEVAKCLADCDVVAVECVAARSEEVSAIEEELNSILAGSEPPTDSITDWKFAGVLAREMAGSHKTMHIIDARFEDRDIFDYDFYRRIAPIKFRPEHNRDAVNEVRRKIDVLMGYIGTSSVAREKLVVEQLRELALLYQAQTIGVVVGYAHTAIPCMISEDYPTERVFAVSGVASHDQFVTYPPDSRLARAYTFGASEDKKNELRCYALAAHLAHAAGVPWGPEVWYDEAAASQLIDDYIAGE